MPISREELTQSIKNDRQREYGSAVRENIFNFLKDHEDQGFTIEEILEGTNYEQDMKDKFLYEMKKFTHYGRVDRIEKDDTTYYMIRPDAKPLLYDLPIKERRKLGYN